MNFMPRYNFVLFFWKALLNFLYQVVPSKMCNLYPKLNNVDLEIVNENININK